MDKTAKTYVVNMVVNVRKNQVLETTKLFKSLDEAKKEAKRLHEKNPQAEIRLWEQQVVLTEIYMGWDA